MSIKPHRYDIFISYRTDENRQKAEHLYTLLDRRFLGQVSYDKESFAGGRCIPYSSLPDGEKEYNRQMAMDTIKLVKKLGFDIVKRT